jgi:protoporphyrinogen oxidase
MGKRVVILGAGPAGLACAYELSKSSDYKVTVIDKAREIGGFGCSFQWKNHILDVGPHAFHTRGGEPESLVRSLFKDSPIPFFTIGKRNYPLQVSEVFLKFNPLLSLKIIIHFILTSFFHAFVSIPIENFEDWGRKRFGSTLYKMSFGDYTEKVWKTKATKISEKFAAEKIQGFNFINLIKRIFKIGGQVTEPYYQNWIYHKYGSGKMFEVLSNNIKNNNGEIFLESKIIRINVENKKVISVNYEKDNKLFTLQCDYLISTIHVPHLLSMLNVEVPFSVIYSASKLSYVSLIIVYLEFNVDKISDFHWIYLLDDKFKFNRITEQKNLSPFTVENGKTVLSFELTCKENDHLWQLEDNKIFEMVINEIKHIPFINSKSINDYLIKRFPNAYELYYKDFDKFADVIFSYLKGYKNLMTIGRRGLFLQGDMHQSMEMGINAAKLLLKGEFSERGLDNYYRTYIKYID